jgi:TrmH family RNA methyltransferase
MLALRDRKERDRSGAFLIEGVRFVLAASNAGASFVSLAVAPALLSSPIGGILLRRLRRSGVPVLEVSADELKQLSLSEQPQGIAAVVAQRWESIAPIVPSPRDLWIAVSTVRSPGNLGTLMRTAAASGARGVIVPPNSSADPYHPGALRAAMGASFSLRMVRAGAAELDRWKKRLGLVVIGADPGAPLDYRAYSYRRPVVLLLGSERKGLSRSQAALCDAQVRIPMSAGDSLNLAVAGSVLLYEIWNQRHPLGRPL